MAIDWDGDVLTPLMGVFAEPVTYMPAAGAQYPAVGVFDREYLDVTLLEDGSENSTRRPVLGVQLSTLSAMPVQNDKVFVPSVGLTYIVREVRPDGHGWAKLMLNQTAS